MPISRLPRRAIKLAKKMRGQQQRDPALALDRVPECFRVGEQEAEQEHGGEQGVIVPIAEQRMRRREARQQDEAIGGEQTGRHDQQQRARQRMAAATRSTATGQSGKRHQHGPERHRIDPEIDDEPKMVPGRQHDAGLRAELRAESPVVTEIKIAKIRRDSRLPRRSGRRPAAAQSRPCRTPAGSTAAPIATAAAATSAYLRSMNRVATPETRNSSDSRQGLSTSISGSSAVMRCALLM